jgi:hypothetical protein
MAEETAQTIYEQTGIVAQTVNQRGEYVAGRDIFVTEGNISQSDLRFIEINLEPYKSGRYVAPKFSIEALNILKTRKLVVIGGSYEFDKNSVIRYLAASLSEEKNVHRVREWADRTKNFSLFSAIIGENEPTIFIFTQITPQDVKFNLDKFIDLANKHGPAGVKAICPLFDVL